MSNPSASNVRLQLREVLFIGEVDTLPIVEHQFGGEALADALHFETAQPAVSIGEVARVFRVNVEDAQGFAD